MMNYISIKNLNFSYGKRKIFNNINIDIKKGSFVAVTSPNSSGKTTLLKIMYASIDTCADILIENKPLTKKRIEEYKNDITLFVPYIRFYSSTILDELLISAKKENINDIEKLLKEFNLYKYINESPLKLSYIDCQKLNLIKAILNNSKLLLIDDIFSYFDKYSKIEFIGFLKKYQIDMNMTIVYATCNLDDIIFCDKVIMINKGELLYDGSVDKIYSDEKILKESKINIPMLNQLIDKLKLYDLINNDTCTIDEVVDEICR